MLEYKRLAKKERKIKKKINKKVKKYLKFLTSLIEINVWYLLIFPQIKRN